MNDRGIHVTKLTGCHSFPYHSHEYRKGEKNLEFSKPGCQSLDKVRSSQKWEHLKPGQGENMPVNRGRSNLTLNTNIDVSPCVYMIHVSGLHAC